MVKKEESFHFIGIGGIGMSALAEILLQRKNKVSGSDIKDGEIIYNLQKKGAKISLTQEKENIREKKIVVYSSVIEKDHPEFLQAKKMQCTLLHRSELLRKLMEEKKALLIAGTHGKTTTASLLANVLISAGKDPSFAVGGILQAFHVNAKEGQGKYFVAETDESDGSFLYSKGFGSIVTNIEKEHMDHWKNETNLKKGFSQFFSQISSKEHFFWCKEDKNLSSLNPKGISYGFSSKADLFAKNISEQRGKTVFDIFFKGKVYKNFELNLFGKFNVLNALAVMGLSLCLGIKESVIREVFSKFLGVKRRQELIGEAFGVCFYDDYAHHPTEVKKTLRAFREKIKEKRLIAIFQPHRFSRFKMFFEEFCNCFSEVDNLIVTDIYRTGEKKIKKISFDPFIEKIKEKGINVSYIKQEKLKEKMQSFLQPHDVVVTVGAGDIRDNGKKIFVRYKSNPKKIKVALIFGGKSSEHEISIASARYVLTCFDQSIYEIHLFGITKKGQWVNREEAKKMLEGKEIKRKNYFSKDILFNLQECNVAFPIIHGVYGEDGMLPAFFSVLNLPYCGASYGSSAISMNKSWAKNLVKAHGIEIMADREIFLSDWKKQKEKIVEKIKKELSFPVYVKPVHLGSSIGIFYVKEKEAIAQAIEKAFTYDHHLIVEEKARGEEVSFAILGTTYLEVAETAMIFSHGDFVSYEDKYVTHPIKISIPAPLDIKKIEEGKKLAKKVYQLLDVSGYARIDFFITEEEKYFFNEINPIPGFTMNSLFPKMWEKTGKTKEDIINTIIISALHRKRIKYIG